MTNQEDLPAVILEPRSPAQAAVIWLHGLGADGHDFEPLVPRLHLPATAALRFIFPHAPYRPVTINGGVRMRAWYDITGAPRVSEDESGIRASAQALQQFIRREMAAGIAAERILLAGFSQGGAIALHTGLRFPERLAGIAALSTYLPLSGSLAQEAHPANHPGSIFMAHGTGDAITPLPLARQSHDLLIDLGYQLEWHTYPMEHRVCAEEIAAISAWMCHILQL